MVNEKIVKRILKVYEEAWVEQNIDKILSIFTEDGIYHERVLKEPMKGHEEIRKYWQTKVCDEQSEVKFRLLNYYIAGKTLIAEWEASFNSNIENNRIHIKEVAIMDIVGDKIKSLREYWQSEKIPLASS